VLLSSLLAFQGVPRAANYAATKAWAQTFAEGLQGELGPCGVDVIACAPGPVHSGFAAVADMKMGAAVSPPTSPSAPCAGSRAGAPCDRDGSPGCSRPPSLRCRASGAASPSPASCPA